jgi:hypothetical protein
MMSRRCFYESMGDIGDFVRGCYFEEGWKNFGVI